MARNLLSTSAGRSFTYRLVPAVLKLTACEPSSRSPGILARNGKEAYSNHFKAGLGCSRLIPTVLQSSSPPLSILLFSDLSGLLPTMRAFTLAAVALVGSVMAAPDLYSYTYSPSNIVKIDSLTNMCLIAPLNPDTPIGVAEGSGTKTYCTAAGRWDLAAQGQLPSDFFSDAKYVEYSGANGGLIRQITGCINASHLSRLDPTDEGGQFDSSGQGNNGVPTDSFCILPGNNVRGFYVQQIEPAENRFCLRCCADNDDCPHTNDTKGCEVAIPGYYGPSCS
ncbi:hypothetical protein DL93DRAFT_564083 [Clavulina sp. PMI_390]|nr:hypothetical protein DL93DRAFT_564083 [Clavulina sp. PMI_390]